MDGLIFMSLCAYFLLNELLSEAIFNVIANEDSCSVGVLRIFDNCALVHFYL